MITNGARVAATFIIWVALAIILTANGSLNNIDNGALAIVAVTALISTVAVWVAGNVGDQDTRQQGAQSVRRSTHKAKREELSRIEHLVDVLDEDEARRLMDELQARLGHSDGEFTSLEDILSEREAQRRR